MPAGIIARYARNSAPIDSTDILHSILAIDREINFPLNINLNARPNLIQNNTNTTIEYLKLTNSSRNLSSSILKILIEDRRLLILSVLITLEILLSCISVTLLWQLFKLVSLKILLLS